MVFKKNRIGEIYKEDDEILMISRETIQKILEAGVQAPSGSNSQPWSFEVKNNQIYVIAHPEKDHPILNFRNRGTWIAHGALIENVAIAASASGYKADISIFSDKNISNLTAIINLIEVQPKNEPLYDAIFKRRTNRKPYKTESLADEQKNLILGEQKDFPNIEVRLIEDKEKLNLLGQALSANEVVMFGNKALHKLFFDEVVWSEGEQNKKKSGLYIKTLELKPSQQAALKLFKYWPIMNLANKLFGVNKQIAKENAQNYASAAAMGAIIVPDRDEDFIDAGRLTARIWLRATSMELSFHLITGVPFLWQRINSGDVNAFSNEQVKVIKNAYQSIQSICGISAKIPAMIFRIGYCDNPSAMSSKKSPEIKYLI